MSPNRPKNPEQGGGAGSKRLQGDNGLGQSSPEAALTGWIVFRPKPWNFVGVFGSREEAETKRQRAGAHYQVTFGTADVASGRLEPPDGS